MKDLKPCYFCNSTSHVMVHDEELSEGYISHVECYNCQYRTPGYSNRDDAIEMHNKFASNEDQLKAHAIEVLAKMCWKYEHEDEDEVLGYDSQEEWYKDQYRDEARALLGWEE